MIGSTKLEVYVSIFIITEENNKFELYIKILDSEFSFTKLKDDVAEVLDLPDISIEDLEQEKTDQIQLKLMEIYRKKRARLMVIVYFY